jgi:DinB superfamily
MEPEERRVVLEELASSEARLLQLVEGLTQEQWRFRETPERWSIAENIEHCVVFERFIMGVIAKDWRVRRSRRRRRWLARRNRWRLG